MAFVTGQVDTDRNTTGGATSYVCTLTGVTGGNCLIVSHHAGTGSTDPTITVSSDVDGSFTRQVYQGTGNDGFWGWVELWYLPNATAGSHTVTVGSALEYSSMVLAEFDSIPASPTVLSNSASATNTTSLNTGTVSPADTATIVATISHSVYPTDPTIISDLTGHAEISEQIDTDAQPWSFIASSGLASGSYSNTYTINFSSNRAAAAIMSFEEGSPPAGRTTKNTDSWNLGVSVGMGFRMAN